MPDEIGDQIAVDLDSENRRAGIGKRQRQRAAAGTDLEKDIAGSWIDGADDLTRPSGRQEVLTEPLSRPGRPRQSRSVGSLAPSPRQYRSSIASISSSDRPK